ncbi:tetratricopeptide repeat protein, partial [Patescibacteria group bacterium]|nr:tetratricopeptide repeat protein [Patescibacteria group bacterium]
MPERIEQKLFEREIETGPEKRSGLTFLKEEIKELIQEFSAETFGAAKKKKTEEIGVGEKEGIMMEYPAKKYDFRESDWFKKLSPEKREEEEFEIMSFIHKTVKEELFGLHNKFFEKLPPEVQEYFKENRKREEENKEFLLPPKELEEGVIKSIQEFKKQFGFLPESPETSAPNCAVFTNFLGRVFEHYGFKSGPVDVPKHVVSLVELEGNKKYVNDINFPKPLPLKEWIKEMEEQENIKIRDINLGYFGEYESNVHFNLGNFFGELKRFPEAEKEYRKAIEINPNDTASHFNLGLFLFMEMKENNKARNEVLKAKELYKDKFSVEKCNFLLKLINLK